jgi:O-antigen/teichoic acid export membrane protein
MTAAAISVPLASAAVALGFLLEAEHGLVFTSTVKAAMGAATALTTWLLVIVVPLGATGGLLALGAGSAVGAVLLASRLIRLGFSLRPRVSFAYLRHALRLGVPVQLSSFLVAVSARLDILPVQAISGDEAAGLYSVALTMGLLAAYGAGSLSMASYPRLAGLREREVLDYTARLSRTAIGLGVSTALVMTALIPVALPFAFGGAFRPAVPPAILLVIGAILYGEQLVLCRSRAARGRPRLLVTSYGVSIVVMLSLDVWLIPRFHLSGAALASIASSAAGCTIALGDHRRNFQGFRLRHFLVPTMTDAAEVVRALQRIVRAR